MLLLLMGTIMSKGYASFYIGDALLQENVSNDDVRPTGLVSGKISYDSNTNMLTLDNITYKGNNSFIGNTFHGLVDIKGDCLIEAKQTAITIRETALRGDGGTLTIDVSGADPVFPGLFIEVGTLNVSGLHLDIRAKRYPVQGNSNGAPRLKLENASLYAEMTDKSYANGAVSGIDSLIIVDAMYSGGGFGSEFKDGSVVNEDGSVAKTVMIEKINEIRSIFIDDYEWPQDFVAADYDVTTTRPGVKSITIGYEAFRKELPWQDGFNVRANTNYGVYFFVELKEGYTFAQKVKAYVKRDGEWMANPYSTTVNQKKAFIWAAYNETEFKVPVPEGGAYVHTANVVADIAVPEVGAMPQWTIETPAQAKAAGGLPEADAKDLDEHSIVQSSEVSWLKVDAQGYTTEMSKDEKFAPGTKYCCRLFIQPKENMQFHENTRYTFNGKVCGAFNGEVEQGNIFVKGDTCFGGMYDSQLAGIIKVFPATKGDYLGDANQDGTITMADANAVVNYFLAVEKPEGFPLHLANVNGDTDGEDNPLITMADANLIVNSFLSGTQPQVYVPADIQQNDHKYVDLGLSVKWATCNIGASTPYEYGDYFAWGETNPKEYYDWTTYALCGNPSPLFFTKYNNREQRGIVDNKTELEPQDDAATVNWGDAWRMPSYGQLLELRDNCYWEWTDDYNNTGVKGYIVYKARSNNDKGKKKYSGSSYIPSYTYTATKDVHIFLPASGHQYKSSVSEVGTECDYWTSSLYDYKSGHALTFQDVYGMNNRDYGLSVRPVRP